MPRPARWAQRGLRGTRCLSGEQTNEQQEGTGKGSRRGRGKGTGFLWNSLPAYWLCPGDSEVGIPAECPLTEENRVPSDGGLKRHLEEGFPEERTSRLALERKSGNGWG